MSCAVEVRGERLHCSGEMTIYAADELKASLLEQLRTHVGMHVVDLSEVTEIDTCGVQLLLMAQRLCDASSAARLQLVAPSAVVRDTLALCGLTHLIAA